MAVRTFAQGRKEGLNRRIQEGRLSSRDRIAAFAKATEVYAESLEDPDLANVYWGKSLGLWQAVTILSAEDDGSTRRVVSPTALAPQGW